ncbi:hypothetical protein KIPB_003472 [Kipferlia bialata]|uniref:Uncharacterized protein n=1 Tax=Kipferlia bialata TaxID=797122 RepID=A0A9K3CSA3_9EUKA|nr:hypothetical protein KIPB_003472 [Kipferlia bialata]|eukprot:g3472.t1
MPATLPTHDMPSPEQDSSSSLTPYSPGSDRSSRLGDTPTLERERKGANRGTGKKGKGASRGPRGQQCNAATTLLARMLYSVLLRKATGEWEAARARQIQVYESECSADPEGDAHGNINRVLHRIESGSVKAAVAAHVQTLLGINQKVSNIMGNLSGIKRKNKVFPLKGNKYGVVLYRLLELYDRLTALLPEGEDRRREESVMEQLWRKAWGGMIVKEVSGAFLDKGMYETDQEDIHSETVSSRLLLLSVWAMILALRVDHTALNTLLPVANAAVAQTLRVTRLHTPNPEVLPLIQRFQCLWTSMAGALSESIKRGAVPGSSKTVPWNYGLAAMSLLHSQLLGAVREAISQYPDTTIHAPTPTVELLYPVTTGTGDGTPTMALQLLLSTILRGDIEPFQPLADMYLRAIVPKFASTHCETREGLTLVDAVALSSLMHLPSAQTAQMEISSASTRGGYQIAAGWQDKSVTWLTEECLFDPSPDLDPPLTVTVLIPGIRYKGDVIQKTIIGLGSQVPVAPPDSDTHTESPPDHTRPYGPGQRAYPAATNLSGLGGGETTSWSLGLGAAGDQPMQSDDTAPGLHTIAPRDTDGVTPATLSGPASGSSEPVSDTAGSSTLLGMDRSPVQTTLSVTDCDECDSCDELSVSSGGSIASAVHPAATSRSVATETELGEEAVLLQAQLAIANNRVLSLQAAVAEMTKSHRDEVEMRSHRFSGSQLETEALTRQLAYLREEMRAIHDYYTSEQCKQQQEMEQRLSSLMETLDEERAEHSVIMQESEVQLVSLQEALRAETEAHSEREREREQQLSSLQKTLREERDANCVRERESDRQMISLQEDIASTSERCRSLKVALKSQMLQEYYQGSNIAEMRDRLEDTRAEVVTAHMAREQMVQTHRAEMLRLTVELDRFRLRALVAEEKVDTMNQEVRESKREGQKQLERENNHLTVEVEALRLRAQTAQARADRLQRDLETANAAAETDTESCIAM